jgi:integrase/recombinase XerD
MNTCKSSAGFAGDLSDKGAPLTLVSATLGHADLKTTSVYAHARPGESSGRYLKTKF